MAQTLAPDRGPCDFHATSVANNPFISDALIFAAVALTVFDWTEYFFVKKPVLLRPLRPVVYGFRFRDFAVGPIQNLLGRRELNSYGFKFFSGTACKHTGAILD